MHAREAALRQAKAEKLADLLESLGATAATAAALPESHRLIAAELADTRPPSPTTWRTVCETLRGRATIPARVSASAELAARLDAGLIASFRSCTSCGEGGDDVCERDIGGYVAILCNRCDESDACHRAMSVDS